MKNKKKILKKRKKTNKKKIKKSKAINRKIKKKLKFNKKKINLKFKLFFSNLNFKFNISRAFNNLSKKYFSLKKKINDRRERKKLLKLKAMEREKIQAQKKLIQIQDQALKAKELQLKQEKRLEKERKKDLHRFIKLEQSELNREQAEKQKKIQDQLRLEKKIKQFRKREEIELKNLEKYVLKQQRDSYTDVQERIKKIKEKYKALRDQKILEELKERLNKLGIKIEDQDSKEILLEKERAHSEEREKVEIVLESFYRSAHSLCFQINKRYIPRYLSILRVTDRRFETGEIFVKWDDDADDNWLILIYIKKINNNDLVVMEDRSDLEHSITHEFQTNEIFKASDIMVDSLTKLLDRERNKKKVS